MNDRKAFDEFVYTNVNDAVKELHRRQNDLKLRKKIENYFSEVGIPTQLVDPKGKLILFRQLATPNIETSRFLIAADSIGIDPVFFEYHDDKFTPNNDTKKYLGKLAFYNGTGKKGGHIFEYIKVIDFNSSNGKKIKELKTLKSESFIDFHHGLFSMQGHNHISKANFFDASEWLHKCGREAANYYQYYVALFIINGIGFENFVISEGSERNFTRNVFLPAFIRIKNYFNEKPLIVAINPTDIEVEEFWLCYTHNMKDKINNYLIR